MHIMIHHEKSWWLLKHFFVLIAFHDRSWSIMMYTQKSWKTMMVIETVMMYHELLWGIMNPYGKIHKDFMHNHDLHHCFSERSSFLMIDKDGLNPVSGYALTIFLTWEYSFLHCKWPGLCRSFTDLTPELAIALISVFTGCDVMNNDWTTIIYLWVKFQR